MNLVGFKCELLINKLAHDIWLKLDFPHKIKMFTILLGGNKKKNPTQSYEQHTYAIIGKKCMSIKKYLQHIFINNNHQILVKIHMSTPNLHCTIYDSHMPMIKKLLSNIVQLLCKIIDVNNLLYTYVNVMQHINNSMCFHNTICNKHCVWILS